MTTITWVLESVFSTHNNLIKAIEESGHKFLDWDDSFWSSGLPVIEGSVVFHGSLENANRLHQLGHWNPGSLCDTDAFRCTSWYPRAKPWLLNQQWDLGTVEGIVREAKKYCRREGFFREMEKTFIRPDSPLKPFSGRIVDIGNLTLESLDFGYHYDDPKTSVIIAPVRNVKKEWRFVIVDGAVVAGSVYEAASHSAQQEVFPSDLAWERAESIAKHWRPPHPVYVMDLGLTDQEEILLIEVNPFSGADFYACDPAAIVLAIEKWISKPVETDLQKNWATIRQELTKALYFLTKDTQEYLDHNELGLARDVLREQGKAFKIEEKEFWEPIFNASILLDKTS